MVFVGIIISFLVLLLYQTGISTALNLALFPLIFLLIFNRKADYFPSLTLLLFSGSFAMYLVLFSTMLTVLYHWKYFYKSEYKRIFLFTVALLPLFIWLFFYVLLVENVLIQIAFNYLQYYLAVYPFFYGIIISHKLHKNHYRGILIVLFLSVILTTTPTAFGVVRIFFFALPFFVGSVLLVVKYTRKLFYLYSLMVVSMVVFFILQRSALSGVLLLSSTLSMLIIYLRINNYPKTLRFFTSKWLFVFSFIFIGYAISVSERPATSVQYNPFLQEQKFETIELAMAYGVFKTMGDRGPLWRAILTDVVKEKRITPLIGKREAFVEDYYHNFFTIQQWMHTIFILNRLEEME